MLLDSSSPFRLQLRSEKLLLQELSPAVFSLILFPTALSNMAAQQQQQLPLEAKFPLGCVLDDSRSDFVHDQALTLANLVRGELVKKTRFRRLLLGCKSVGKTTLLMGLKDAASAAYPDQLLTFYISYGAGGSTERLATAVCGFLRKHNIIPDLDELLRDLGASQATLETFKRVDLDAYDVLLGDQAFFQQVGLKLGTALHLTSAIHLTPLFTRLSTCLQLANKRLFLLVDELNFVYTGKFEVNGNLIISDLMAIGDDRNGFIHCVISGSSSNLRRLAFAKLPEDEWKLYPQYKPGFDLNNTKFQARWIYPFLDAASFTQLFHICQAEKASPLDDSFIPDAFVKTGGSPGGLDEWLETRNPPTYNSSAKTINFALSTADARATVLLEIHQAQSRLPEPATIFDITFDQS